MSATRKPAPSELGAAKEWFMRDDREPLDTFYPEDFKRLKELLPPAESGAPLQPGATQPEPDGVAHETKPIESMWPKDLTLCSLCRKDLLTTKHRWGFIGKVDCPYHPLAYTQIELNDRLERMARLVVQEAVSAFERGAKLPFGCANDNVKAAIRAIADDTKLLQQLREAVERP